MNIKNIFTTVAISGLTTLGVIVGYNKFDPTMLIQILTKHQSQVIINMQAYLMTKEHQLPAQLISRRQPRQHRRR